MDRQTYRQERWLDRERGRWREGEGDRGGGRDRASEREGGIERGIERGTQCPLMGGRSSLKLLITASLSKHRLQQLQRIAINLFFAQCVCVCVKWV